MTVRGKSSMRELMSEARLHGAARAVSPSVAGRVAARLHAAALYSALGVIALIVFGTLSYHPF